MKYSNDKNEIITDYVLAQRIICSKDTTKEEFLLQDLPRQASLGNGNFCQIQKGGYVLLDFGEEFHGGINITVQRTSQNDAKMRIVFGESVMEALSAIGEKNATNDHAVRDITAQISRLSNFRVGHTGFRFVKLEAVNADLLLGGVQGAFDRRDIAYVGSFECSDSMLNRIWQVGARTVYLNMQEYLWDGIKRDRLVWIGDMHAEVSVISSVFGYNSVVEKSLNFVRDTTLPNEWMNTLPSYSFWWLIIQYDWYLQNGNLQYLRENKDYIFAVTEHILENIAEDCTDTFETYFIDWETKESADARYGFLAILYKALAASCKFCEIFENKMLLTKCRRTMESIQKTNFGDVKNKQVAALIALADLGDVKKINAEILSKEPVLDISCYLGYYTLLARAKANDAEGAIRVAKGFWGKMIELGATTFWESFDVKDAEGAAGIDRIATSGEKDIHGDCGKYCYQNFRCSLCHGWAGGPTAFLSKCILGVTVLEPGCKKVMVRPQLGGLDYVKGTYPTPYGNIVISAHNSDGTVVTEITAPKEVEIIR